MMDQIASLVQRGLISPDAAQGFVQQIANVPKPGVPNPPLEGGGAGTRIGETTPREPLLGTAKDVPNHLERLRSAGTDQARFRSALDELSADKSVKNDDLKQIVKDYDAGGVVMGKTRADHLRQIEQAFVRNARFENKLK